MATRYWRGGTGTWNSTNTTNWSTTSGGAGGASVPTSADDVIINASSGGGTITQGINATCRSINTTGFTGSMVNGGYATTVTAAANSTLGGGTYSGIFEFTGAGGGTLTVNVAYGSSLYFSVSSGTFTIANSCTIDGIRLQSGHAGTLSSTGVTITTNNIIGTSGMSGTFNAGTVNGTGTFPAIEANGGTIAITSMSGVSSIRNYGTGSLTVSAITSFPSNFSVTVGSTGSLTFPSWPSSATVSSLGITKSGTGTISPSIPSSLTGYSSLSLSGQYISLSSVSGISDLTLYGSASVSTASVTSTVTLFLSAYIGNLSFSGTSLIMYDYPSSSTNAIGTFTKSSGTSLTLSGSGTQGRIGTFNYQVNGATLTLNSSISTFNVNTLNLGPTSGSMIVASSTPSGTRAKLTVNSSYTLRNIEWRGIEALGAIPFTGTGFIDGGNNLNISFSGVGGSGLFFGSNF